MPSYQMEVEVRSTHYFTVEADSSDAAIEIAKEKVVELIDPEDFEANILD